MSKNVRKMNKNISVSRQRQYSDAKKDAKKDNTRKNINAPKTSEPETGGLVFPGGDTAFKALLSARFCAAIWSHISDCDETYNFWEPAHFLVFGKGMQTWEYSPEYALRSYTYLLIHAAPAYIYHKILQPNPLLIFYFLRCLLGLASALSEVYFYKSVCREFGVNVGRMTLAFLLFSAGMFISSAAFLPSSWAMYATNAAIAAWWQRRYPLAVFFIALSSLLGWPFAALLGVPIAIDMLVLRRLYKDFIQWSVISAVVILAPMVIIDSMYYGKLVLPPWNIIKYNVLAGKGSELYGVEPLSYYLMNGFLNFNIIWVFALLTPVAIGITYIAIPAKSRGNYSFPYILSLSPLYLWLMVFFIQPHKEERFLFPVYPMICLCGAITVDVIQKIWFRIYGLIKNLPPRSHYLDKTSFIMIIVMVLSALLGLSRILALYRNYHAPLDLMMELNRFPTENTLPKNQEINVCIGKEWHRYPSSFFLPNTNWNIQIIKSEFAGMIPAHYSRTENSTQLIHEYFNDDNLEEPSLYFNISHCNFLLDLDLNKPSELEPNYASQKSKWTILKSLPFLDAEKSHRLFRAFMVPYFFDDYITYGQFSLLQAVKNKSQNQHS